MCRNYKHTATLTLALLAIVSCKKSDTPTTYDCTGTAPTYSANVKAIMDANCASGGCHSATTKAAGKDLSTYDGVKIAAANSSFMGSMEHLKGYDAMPKGAAKLSDDNLKTISCWIKNGMLQ